MVEGINAEEDRSGKCLVLDQEFNHFPRHHLASIMFSIRFQCTARLQNGHPLDSVDVAADLFTAWQQDMILDIQDPGGSIGALEEYSQLNEFPTFVVRHRGLADTLEQLGSFQSPFVKFVGATLKQPFRVAGQEKQIHPIDLFPHLDGDLFADGPSIFSREGHAGVNRVRIFPFEGDEINDRITGNLGIKLFEKFGVFQSENDRFPMLIDWALVVATSSISWRLTSIMRALFSARSVYRLNQ